MPYVGKTNIPYQNVGAGLIKVSALMETFSLPPPFNFFLINMISSNNDPWIIPSPDQINNFDDTMTLSLVEQAYQLDIVASTVASETHDQLRFILNLYLQTPWLCSYDYEDALNEMFLTYESIAEVMSLEETLWN